MSDMQSSRVQLSFEVAVAVQPDNGIGDGTRARDGAAEIGCSVRLRAEIAWEIEESAPGRSVSPSRVFTRVDGL